MEGGTLKRSNTREWRSEGYDIEYVKRLWLGWSIGSTERTIPTKVTSSFQSPLAITIILQPTNNGTGDCPSKIPMIIQKLILFIILQRDFIITHPSKLQSEHKSLNLHIILDWTLDSLRFREHRLYLFKQMQEELVFGYCISQVLVQEGLLNR